MKTIYGPPLPFLGSKRDFVKQFIKLLLEAEYKGIITRDTIFLDVFGGSGILAHNIKMNFPKNRVIWNDFDSYQVRLDNLKNTNELLKRIFNTVTTKQGFKVCELDFIEFFEGFKNIRIITRKNTLTKNSKYNEYMIFQDKRDTPPPTTSKEKTLTLKL